MLLYNWQQKNWPNFSYDTKKIENLLFQFAEKVGHASGILKSLPEKIQTETIINIMVAEAIKTSEIEGEYISRKDVHSSIKKNWGLTEAPLLIKDKRAKGIGELMMDVRNTFADELTEKKLFEWHDMLMQYNRKISIGQWRKHKEPMQIVSGTVGEEKIHFEAPPSDKVSGEMKRFISWFNETAPGGKKEINKAPLRAAVAHLYFESIHPFEDGNGRIGRAIAEKALSQGIGRPVILSLSKIIEADRKGYYDTLGKACRSNEITSWIIYFVNVVVEAQAQAEIEIEFILKKTRFFDRFKNELNERQLKVIGRMLEECPNGFEGGINAKKYMGLTKASKATATRDLQDLLEKKVLISFGGGRSTAYKLNI